MLVQGSARRFVFAVMLALAFVFVVTHASVIFPGPDYCEYLDNAFLRWLYGCPPLPAGGGGGGAS
jgi:hypothetical protein